MRIRHRLSGEILWIAIGIFISMGIVLVGTRFLTTVLSRAEYGRLVLMISLAALFDQVIGHAIGGAAMRFYSIYRLEKRLSDLRDIIFRYLLVSALACIFGAVLVNYLRWPKVDSLLFLTFAFSIALLVSGVGIRLAEGARRRRISATFRTSFELTRFCLAAIFIYFGSRSAESAMGGFMVGAGVIACLHWFYIRFRLLNDDRKIEEYVKQKQLAKSFRKYAEPLLIVGFGTWIFLMSPVWALGWFCEIDEVGGFGAINQLAFVPMLVVSGLLLTFLAPIIYEKTLDSTDKVMKSSNQLTIITLAAVLFSAVIAYFGHQPIATLLLGEHFRTNSWMFPWLIMAGGFYGVAQQFLLKLRAEMKTLKLAVFQLVFALIAVIFYSLAAKLFALEGLVYAVTTLNTLLLISAFVFTGTLQSQQEPLDINNFNNN
jgi:O-antigen/teichoic acid export membrane protein